MDTNGEKLMDGSADGTNKKLRAILDAARKLFLDQGYDTTSMDLIANRAAVSKATLYVYFQSKEALLLELVEEECRSMAPTPIWEPEAGPLDVEATLRRIATRFTGFFLTDHGLALHHLVMVYAARFPEIGQIFYKAGPKRVHEQVAAFFRAASAQGQLVVPDINLAVTQFLSLVRGDLPLNRALSMPRPSKAELDNLIEGGIRVFLAAYEQVPDPRIRH